MVAALLLSTRGSSLLVSRRRAGSPRCEELPSFDLTLAKPLGIVFEEADSGGLFVAELQPGGSAAASATVWPYDLLLAVDGRDCRDADFDSAMDLLIDAPPTLTLTIGRERGRAAALRLPGGLVFASPGDELSPILRRCKYEVEYDCLEGSCGVCEVFLQDEEAETGRPVRACKKRLPTGKSASLMPLAVLPRDSPEARAYDAAMEERLKKRTT
jgi:ferredoxin